MSQVETIVRGMPSITGVRALAVATFVGVLLTACQETGAIESREALPLAPEATSAQAATAEPIATAIPKPTATAKPKPKPTAKPQRTAASAYYKNCSAARAAGVAPLHRGDPGYRSQLDRDGDGIACE